jgi:uncharacterized repeat protein (TIGR01451 family)
MVKPIEFNLTGMALMVLGIAFAVSAQSRAALAPALADDSAAAETKGDTLAVKASAEVETKISLNGRDTIKLVPADRVVPGDEVIYTLEIRNTGQAPVLAPSVRFAIPNHMRYIADSAAGPGAEVSFSVDGGRTFDLPENLLVAGQAGQLRPATAADYTHIRWQLKHRLNANSVAFARFRAVVK